MSGPKLLDKKLVSAELATERKQQIDQGLRLAQKVDVLRETSQLEEQNLEKFRSETIRHIQEEIDAKVKERDSLERGNIALREERIVLSAPIDLTEARDKVREDRLDLDRRNEQLVTEEISLIAREATIVSNEKRLLKQEENISRRDELSERTLIEAESKHETASETLDTAIKFSQKRNFESTERENAVSIRENDIDYYTNELDKHEKKLNALESDLVNREQKLRSRQETFMKAQNYIKNKK